MKTNISILGSTGSIGLNTLKVINKKQNIFNVNLLSANKNYKLICKQIYEYKPKVFIVNDYKTFLKVKKKFINKKILILNSFHKLKLKKKSNITISSIPGLDGLLPTILMIKFSKKILIANKEAIVCGWKLINTEAKKNKTKIIPIDSEHYSILKLLEDTPIHLIEKIFITASGGPFLNLKSSEFKNIKPKDALRHPKWKMGKKISIDSSTLMNKILEKLEAQKLFNLPDDKIDILIHPDSLVHAIIQLKNGLVKLLFHDTNMIIPIANGIFDGDLNIEDIYKPNINFQKKNSINLFFKKIDKKKFPLINLKDKINKFPSAGLIINAANEVLVNEFLNKRVSFSAISQFIFLIMKDRNYLKYAIKDPKSLREVILIDKWARKITIKILNKK